MREGEPMSSLHKPSVADANPFADLQEPEPAPAAEPPAATSAARTPVRKTKQAKARNQGVSQGYYAGKRAITGYIDKDAYTSLLIFKEAFGFSVAGMVEEAIDDYIAKIRADKAYRKILDPNS